MIDAKVLATGSRAGESYEVWGIWMPRRGDNVMLTVEVVANFAATFEVQLFEKNYDEPGNGFDALVGTAFPETTGRSSFTKFGAKELIRVRLSIIIAGSAPDGDVGLLLYRFLEPVWFEDVA
jgi:hypothetical protein